MRMETNNRSHLPQNDSTLHNTEPKNASVQPKVETAEGGGCGTKDSEVAQAELVSNRSFAATENQQPKHEIEAKGIEVNEKFANEGHKKIRDDTSGDIDGGAENIKQASYDEDIQSSESTSTDLSDSESESESTSKSREALDRMINQTENVNLNDKLGPRTEHELPRTEFELSPLPESIEAGEEIEVAGKILSLQRDLNSIVVKATSIVGGLPVKALDHDSLICTASRNMIGRIEEVFGPVINPFYVVRLMGNYEVSNKEKKEESAELRIGEVVYLVKKYGNTVDPATLDTKGSDASNLYNEEPGEEEIEYSDDEVEAQAKQQQKLERQPKARAFGRSRIASNRDKRKRGSKEKRRAYSSSGISSNTVHQVEQELTGYGAQSYHYQNPYNLAHATNQYQQHQHQPNYRQFAGLAQNRIGVYFNQHGLSWNAPYAYPQSNSDFNMQYQNYGYSQNLYASNAVQAHASFHASSTGGSAALPGSRQQEVDTVIEEKNDVASGSEERASQLRPPGID